ncbi:NAD(P)/FAD-dependent oxidoreductase [Methylomicrobium lacus]|uniref:NAD(P)/FAD-dependent oxidoreductase n=1 Tax=Methylomicrobium lacus TaxID=136992 RepID=UPI00045E638E|nr:FAD-dependent oxidoreductase [Methylomicrobium lacus]
MQVVIIGSGIAGVTFAEKYRALNADAEITIVTHENDGYYSRPLLSRGFSKDTIEETIILKSFAALRENRIDIISGAEITAIHPDARVVDLEGACQEKSLSYDKLIIAQGSAAFIPPPLRAYHELFFCLNSLADLKTLRKFRQGILGQNRQPDWAIIGGGLIGCELASDLAVSGDSVTVYHAMDRLMERQLVEEDSLSLLENLNHAGVDVLLNQSVQSIANEGDKVCVLTEAAAEFDAVIVACGFKPRTELAEQAGLAVGRGIKVDECLKTSDEHIYAVGDVAELPNGKLYAFILPIRSQANWLASFLAGQEEEGWTPPVFTTKAKVHGFEAAHPYHL